MTNNHNSRSRQKRSNCDWSVV